MTETSKPLTERQQAVLRNVEFQEYPTVAEVAEMLKISAGSVQTALAALERRGLVRKAGYGDRGARTWTLASRQEGASWPPR